MKENGTYKAIIKTEKLFCTKNFNYIIILSLIKYPIHTSVSHIY